MEGGISLRLARPLLPQISSSYYTSSNYTSLNCTNGSDINHSYYYYFQREGEALESLKKSHMAAARSEITELVLSLLDGIPELACRGGSCQGVIWCQQMETSCSKISFLWVSERDCYLFRRLIFQRFLVQVKNNTLISIYKTVPQKAPRKNGFSDQRSRGNIAKSIPLYNLLYAAAHSSIWKAPAHHMVKKPI